MGHTQSHWIIHCAWSSRTHIFVISNTAMHSYKAWDFMYSKERYWASPIVVVLAQKQSWFRQSSFRISPFELQEVPLEVRLQWYLGRVARDSAGLRSSQGETNSHSVPTISAVLWSAEDKSNEQWNLALLFCPARHATCIVSAAATESVFAWQILRFWPWMVWIETVSASVQLQWLPSCTRIRNRWRQAQAKTCLQHRRIWHTRTSACILAAHNHVRSVNPCPQWVAHSREAVSLLLCKVILEHSAAVK